jgi:hypothetical protein
LSGLQHVDDEAAARLRDIATRARAALVSAGIPAFDSEDPSPDGGASVQVDTGDDAAGGVYVQWVFPRSLTDDINAYIIDKQFTHPTVKYSGVVYGAMRDALLSILRASGFSAELADEDMRPFAVVIS